MASILELFGFDVNRKNELFFALASHLDKSPFYYGSGRPIVPYTADSPCQQYYLVNADTNAAVYVRINTTNSFNVSLPDVTPDYVIALPPYAYKVITGPQVSSTTSVYARVIGDATNASVYITPGEGF